MFGIFDKIKEFFQEIFIGIIQSNLEAMFVDINDKVTFVSNEVGKTPQSFNGEVFSFIKNINDSVIIPIAGLIITAVLCIELIQTVMNRNNMHDGDSFELFKYVFKMAVAVYLVSHAFEFAMASFDVAQNLVSKAAGVINTSSNLSSSEFTSMIEALKEKDVGELIVIALETSIIKMLIQGVSILITIIVYGRMFEIYVYSAVASIPFSTMGNKEWGSIGTNYIKGLFALALQGLFLMICLGIYAVLIKTVNITDIHASTFMILAYTILLGLMMLKSGTIAKSIMNAH
ncbi:VirB6/TrbL-like conjugal transfer protein, CD1112 family [Clostridium perfringens]